MSVVVIVGLDLREAQALAMQRRTADRGKRVLLASPRSADRLPGLLVAEWEATPRAMSHRDWPRIHNLLAASQRKNGVKTTSE